MEAVEALQPDLYVTMSDEVWAWFELSVVGLLELMPPMLIIWFMQIMAEANRKKARASVDRTVKVGQRTGSRQAGDCLGHSICVTIFGQ